MPPVGTGLAMLACSAEPGTPTEGALKLLGSWVATVEHAPASTSNDA